MKSDNIKQGLTGSGKEDALSEGQYWFREVEKIVRFTREEAQREGLSLPADFANTPKWREADAAIEKAMSKGDYIKTRDLARDYTTRAVKYCQTLLENKRKKLAQKEIAACQPH